MGGDITKKMSDEEAAINIVKLYFEHVARLGFKRKLDLDTIINAYLYTYDRLQRKKQELITIDKIVDKEEAKISSQTKEELLKDLI